MTFPRVRHSLFSLPSPLRALALGASLLLGAGACQPELGEPAAEDGLVTAREELRVANSLKTRALVLNALSTNPDAIPLLVGGGLVPLFSPDSGNAYLQRQLRDPDAQELMSYLVGCALPSGTHVTWKNPLTGKLDTWEGKVGLCPVWKSNAPTAQCQHWVSACLLARNNAEGRRVELSIRGEDPARPAFFSLESVSAPVPFDPTTAEPLASVVACATSTSGMGRDCGWKAEAIGQCAPQQTVRLGAGGQAPDQCGVGPVLGASSGRMMLRVCDDIFGCDQAAALAESMGTCRNKLPAVTFTCPNSGFFSVMSAPYTSGQAGSVTVGVETGTTARTDYPRSEARTFFLREGAYYGNIFDAKALAATVQVNADGRVLGKEQIVKGSVYRRMYSCQAAGWSDAQAYATHRLCALPETAQNCAAKPVGLCVDPKDASAPASRCRQNDGALVAGDGDFEECSDDVGTTWLQPITVFLHDVCGAVPELCTDGATRPAP